MKEKFIFWFLLVSIPVLITACFYPNISDCTIVVSNVNNHNCNVYVTLDGASQENVTGTTWTYQNIPTGKHTLNFSTSGSVGNGNNSCTGQNNCGFGTSSSPPSTQNVSFNTNAGSNYTFVLNNDYNFCGNIIITGP